MDKHDKREVLAFPSGFNKSLRAHCSMPFTSPTVPQQTAHVVDDSHHQQTRRRKASIGQENDLFLRRSKRLNSWSTNNASLMTSHSVPPVAAPTVTPSPRIMQVAAHQQFVMSPIAKVISSKRRSALVQAAKSQGAHIHKQHVVPTRNKKGKTPNSSNARRYICIPSHSVPHGIPNIFSSSMTVSLFDSSRARHCSALESEMGYWVTYGFEYYEFLSLNESKKIRKDDLTESYSSFTPSNICTRSMSKRFNKNGEENHLESKKSFFKNRPLLPTTDEHCYKDKSSDERHRMLWDCSFPKHQELTPFMRTVLIHWLLEVGQCYNLVSETMHLTVKLIDRVLAIGLASFNCPYKSSSAQNHEKSGGDEESFSQQVDWEISKAKLQCVGSACMLIASKLEEINPPSASDFASISGSIYTVKDILSMELQICLNLKFELHLPTPIHFIESYLFAECHHGKHKDEKVQLKCLTLYLLELSLLEHSFTQYPSSMIAASALYLAKVFYFNATCKSSSATINTDENELALDTKQHWDDTLAFYTGYTASDMKETISRLFFAHSKALDTPIHHAVFLRHQQKGFMSKALSANLQIQNLWSPDREVW